MPIRSINKSFYSTSEVQILAKNILQVTTTLEPAKPVVIALSESLSTSYDTLRTARNNSRYNTQTLQVAEADEARDLAFRAFYTYVEAGSIRQNEVFREASLTVLDHLVKIDRFLPKMGYSKQSTELVFLFSEMEKANESLTTIGADAWLEELKQAEADFLAKREGRLNEEIEKQVLIPTKIAKEQTLDQLIAIVQTLNGLELARIEGVSDLNTRIDQVIAEVEIPARARQSRRSNREESGL